MKIMSNEKIHLDPAVASTSTQAPIKLAYKQPTIKTYSLSRNIEKAPGAYESGVQGFGAS